MNELRLTDNSIRQFQAQGFLIVERLIDQKKIDSLKTAAESLFRGKFETKMEPDEWNWRQGRDPDNITRQICNAWKSNNRVKETVCHPYIGRTITKLMNWRGARLLQDNILWKPPGAKSLIYHQDASYDDWVIPQTMASCWIALDETSGDSGSIEYVVGSHKWDLMPPTEDFHAPDNYKKNLELYVERKEKDIETVKVTVPAGGGAFHHGKIWHGSGKNDSRNHRRAIVSHCVPIDAKFHPTNCGGTGRIYKKYKLNGSNELNESFFPTLWENIYRL